MEKAKGYTGTISHADITGQRVAIATGFGTANKRKNLELVEKYLYSGELSQEESEVLNFLKSV